MPERATPREDSEVVSILVDDPGQREVIVSVVPASEVDDATQKLEARYPDALLMCWFGKNILEAADVNRITQVDSAEITTDQA